MRWRKVWELRFLTVFDERDCCMLKLILLMLSLFTNHHPKKSSLHA